MNDKLQHELDFWKQERRQYLRWYNGEIPELYFASAPQEHQKITRFDDPLDNALYTWMRADWNRYLRHLMLDEFYFEGDKVLDVGSGPLGLARAFAGADLSAIDPLSGEYWKLGYPTENDGIWYYPSSIEHARELGLYKEFDAVISVNAIDHVDDFEKAIEAIEHILKDDGIVRVEVHYHAPTDTEPMVLNDDRVAAAFDIFDDVRKISDVPFRHFYPGFNDPDERLTLWSNDTTLVEHDPLPRWTV